jgi:hypothetical protein
MIMIINETFGVRLLKCSTEGCHKLTRKLQMKEALCVTYPT